MSSSKKPPNECPQAQSSPSLTTWRKTTLDSKVAINEDAMVAAAALANLTFDAPPRHTASSDSENQNEEPAKVSSPASSSKQRNVPTPANNRAARRQEARKREKARREMGNDSEGGEEDVGPDKEIQDVSCPPLNIGFMPDDYPLSSTDEEAEDSDKEREERVQRSRKRQLKRHLAQAMNTSWPVKWDDVFAQLRVLDIKWINDDLLSSSERAAQRDTSWLKQVPQQTWLGDSTKRLEAIRSRYKLLRVPKFEQGGPVYDQYKAVVLSRAMTEEIMKKTVEGMQASLRESEKREKHKEGRVLGYDVLSAPNGDLCIGVRLPKKEGRQV